MGLLKSLGTRSAYRLYRAPYYRTARAYQVGKYLRPDPKIITSQPWRGTFRTPNMNMLPMVVGSDRRYYHPYGVNKPAVTVTGKQVTPTDVSFLPKRIRRDRDMFPYTDPSGRTKWVYPSRISDKFSTQLQMHPNPWWYGFLNADKVAICLKRKMRREVLNALGIAGNTGFKPAKFNQMSRVRC